VDCSKYDALVELATICCLCNDSSLHYNEVQLTILVCFQCFDSVGLVTVTQGAYRSGKVVEFEIHIFHACKSHGIRPPRSWKVLENQPNGCHICDLCMLKPVCPKLYPRPLLPQES